VLRTAKARHARAFVFFVLRKRATIYAVARLAM
jgi:hypothetical protein